MGGGGGKKKGRGYKSNLWTSHYLSPRGGGWRILVMSQQNYLINLSCVVIFL